ncbi:MAG TPA: hypothetical protein VIK91_25350 [Nannocystis sp.]
MQNLVGQVEGLKAALVAGDFIRGIEQRRTFALVGAILSAMWRLAFVVAILAGCLRQTGRGAPG